MTKLIKNEIHFKDIDLSKIPIRMSTGIVLKRISQMQHNPKIRYIILFGSEARGEAVLTSDVDIALVSDIPLTVDERLEFTEIFQDEKFPEYRVINTLTDDLHSENIMNVNYHIKRDGLVIYAR